MFLRLLSLLELLSAFWKMLLELVGFWWWFYSYQAELGPPGGETYLCPCECLGRSKVLLTRLEEFGGVDWIVTTGGLYSASLPPLSSWVSQVYQRDLSDHKGDSIIVLLGQLSDGNCDNSFNHLTGHPLVCQVESQFTVT
jgi:hypothetical protein